MEFTVSRAGASVLNEAAAVTGRAFYDDPMFDFYFPDRLDQHRWLDRFMGPTVRDAHRYGEVWTASLDGHPKAVAGWLGPGTHPRGRARDLRLAAAMLPALRRIAHSSEGQRLMAAVEHRTPREPHWYLAVLAVDPAWQRRGLGGRLLEAVLPRVDAEGLPAVLETQKEANLAFYGRYGFEVTHTLGTAPSPPLWLMRRPPR